MRRELICREPSLPPRLQVRESAMPEPRRGQVLVRVDATSVNPIDAKRAGGYGRRLLGLKGAARFPLVLGNDLAGTRRGRRRRRVAVAPGQRVFGLVGTGRAGGAHASHVVVPQESLLAAAPKDVDAAALAVLPYSFTTMWLAVRSTGLTAANARRHACPGQRRGRRLGRLALQVLCGWGCRVTAICGRGKRDECRALGAAGGGRTRARRIELAAHGLRRRAELRELGRRARARVAPGTRRAGPCDDGASAARRTSTGWAGCAVRSPAGVIRKAVRSAVHAAIRRRALRLDHLQARSRCTRRAGRRGARARLLVADRASRRLRQGRPPRSPMSRPASPAVPCCCPDPHRPTPTSMTAHEWNCLPWPTSWPSNAPARRCPPAPTR